MFTAIDENGNKTDAKEGLSRQTKYYCRLCKGEVRFRCGDNNAPHFAHINSCTDDFTNDMSEWHKSWQELFPLRNREVVIEHNNELHRADVLCYGTVIEFQHSPISKSEFERRNEFYTNAGRKVVWIFDLTELFSGNDESGRLYISGDWCNQWGKGSKFIWKHPWRFLEDFLPQDEKNIDIFFNTSILGDNPKSEEADGYLDKVVWVDPYYKTLWGKFHSNYRICNYFDLLKYLKERHEQSQSFDLQRNYEYQVDGKMVEATEFDRFLEENKPYHILTVGQKNPRYGSGQNGETLSSCSDPHQKPVIQLGHCQLGCYSCLAIEEVSKTKQIIYCKSGFAKGKKYDPKYFKKIYK